MEENQLSTNVSLEKQLLDASDPQDIRDIVNLFNMNIKKKDILRASRINTLQDQVVDQVEKRLTKRGDEFSNRDLLEYYKVLQATLDNIDSNVEEINSPSIQINQNTINLVDSASAEKLSRSSREKIFNVVRTILDSTTEEGVDIE